MEILDVLDENGNVVGKEERTKVHSEGLWHIHVGIWLMNEKGELLFQKRSNKKKVNPGKWTRTGGHVDAGESPEVGMQRELEEEMGLHIDSKNFELMEINKEEIFSKELGTTMRHFVYSYFAYTNAKIEDCKLQEEEVSDAKYMSIEEIEKLYEERNENYTFINWKNFPQKIEKLKQKREQIKSK